MISARVRVPATSANLGPGFDTLGLAFQFYNYVSISDLNPATATASEANPDLIEVQGAGAAQLQQDSENIALQAAQRLLQYLQIAPPPLHLKLENQIPLSRGLGSSAAARVGALVAANEWARRKGERTAEGWELLALASELEGHPDNVAAALFGGLIVSCATENPSNDTGQNSISHSVVAMPVSVSPFPALIAFAPSQELGTKAARAVLPPLVPREDAVFNLARTALLLTALQNGQWRHLPEALQDRLHQPQRAALMPGFSEISRAAVEAGAFGATLSGAGPTILAWLPRDEYTIARVATAMQEAAAEAGVAGQILPLEVDTRGCVLDE